MPAALYFRTESVRTPCATSGTSAALPCITTAERLTTSSNEVLSMATRESTAPAVAYSEVPAMIAGSVNLMRFSEALARAGIVGRFDPHRGVLVIEPAKAREPAHDAANARIGMAWWNGLTPTRRRYWLEVAGSARPADAFEAWRRSAGSEL